MKIALITPAAKGSRYGNRNTATRWAGMLRDLGHRVVVDVDWNRSAADVMIALHARRSFGSIQRFADTYPGRPLFVTLTGTDLYRDIQEDANAQESLRLATLLIVLQDMGISELAPALRLKTRIVYQSAPAIARKPPLKSCFEVIISGHLREEKDPFRTAAALVYLPQSSHIRVTHIGAAMSLDFAKEARRWMQRDPRYRWLGEVAHGRALRLLARARLMVISSHMEGGANVVCEALATGVPVIASRVPGNIGMLGRNYAGYYPVAEEGALAKLLTRAEKDLQFLHRLGEQCRARKHLVTPERESATLQKLLADFT